MSAVLTWAMVWLAADSGRPPASFSSGALASPPAPAPEAVDRLPATPPLSTAQARSVRLSIDAGDDASYWLREPPGYKPGQRPPLLIFLHGTDDTARDAMSFWSARRHRVPMVIATPQASGQGWSDADVRIIRAMLNDLERRAPYDPERVLLAGFSAGGSMALHLLYQEKLPVTAVAALGNYVPPYITAEDVRARREVPVFYAVGLADLNHERMRSGIALLRGAGGNVYLHRPPIGHVLDVQVGQEAVDWFFDRCAITMLRTLGDMDELQDRARAVIQLEGMISQAAWHEPDHLQLAERILARLEAEARAELDEAQALATRGRPLEAVDLLADMETRYGMTRIGREAREARQRLTEVPHIHELVMERESRRRAEEAMSLYAEAQRLVARNRFADAAANCRHIVSGYGDTPAAVRAATLLDILEKRVPRERLATDD